MKLIPESEMRRSHEDKEDEEFYNNVFSPILKWEGDKVPVSQFEPGGYLKQMGTTKYERRQIALYTPSWKPNECTQCNYCAIVCPHAAIRPFLLDREDLQNVPEGYETRKTKGGGELAGLNYTIQISPNDCTGCEVCVQTCPDDALFMEPVEK